MWIKGERVRVCNGSVHYVALMYPLGWWVKECRGKLLGLEVCLSIHLEYAGVRGNANISECAFGVCTLVHRNLAAKEFWNIGEEEFLLIRSGTIGDV